MALLGREQATTRQRTLIGASEKPAQSTKPVLAAISGTAVGGGLEFTYHADIRFAASDARLGQPEVAIGFIPPCGATVALSRLMGRSRATRYLYDGELCNVETAARLGIIDEIVEPDSLRRHVQSYAEDLASKSPQALQTIRQTIQAGQSEDFQAAMANERRHAISLSQTAWFQAGVSNFLSKQRS